MTTSTAAARDRIDGLLSDIYGGTLDSSVRRAFRALVDGHHASDGGEGARPCAWLITYPDHVSDDRAPLAVLREVLDHLLPDQVEGVHVLPCYPSSSDEGFSVKDYTTIDPSFGSWSDIEALARTRHVMLDAVVNHASAQGTWFDEWRRGVPGRAGFFRTEDPTADLTAVVRAREHPLLTRFQTSDGDRWVWTTFSPDQVDLDYRNPAVALAVAEVLLTYAAHGARAIRLDAIGFLWKQAGTPSIHLPETHRVIQLMRAVLDATYPYVALVTETNVPHAENVSYLGDGTVREADMVYQFPLPPLTLHAFATGDATVLETWLRAIGGLPPHTTFFNFLSSHDGVGLRPLEGLVSREDVDLLVAACRANGGRVSSRSGPDGSSVPYELNATWYDLIRGPHGGDDALARHLGSHALMFALRGEPAVYLQSFVAEPNATDLAASTGVARSMNRRRFRFEDLKRRLEDPTTNAARSVDGLGRMLAWRSASSAFDPLAAQRVLDTPAGIVGIERVSADGSVARVHVNVSGSVVSIPRERPTTVRGFRVEADTSGLRVGPWGVGFSFDED